MPTLAARPEFAPTAAEQEKLRRAFGLSYHVAYAAKAAEMVGFAGKRVLEVGGSLPPDFVRQHLGAAQWTAVEELSYWREVEKGGHKAYGPLAKSYTRHLPEAVAADVDNHEYLLLDGAIEQAPATLDGQFDLAFSIACFEHVSRLPRALTAIHRLLRPGGKLFTMFSPIWSAHDGHHLPVITDAAGQTFVFNRNCPIPPWGHLVCSPSELFEFLLTKTDPTAAEEMVYYTYHAPNINRLFAEDYLRYFAMSPFNTLVLVETFKRTVEPRLQAELEAFHPGKKRFGNNGFLVILQKPE
jgi:SAM-dependent methyltransferase